MADLKILQTIDPKEVGRAYALAGSQVTIGRQEGNALVFQDPSLSRCHAILMPAADGWLLKDNGSANGTFINGAPVTEQVLRHGDRIEVGKTSLLYEQRTTAVRPTSPSPPSPTAPQVPSAARAAPAVKPAVPPSPAPTVSVPPSVPPPPAAAAPLPAPKPAAPKCAKCGKPLKPGFQFCTECGAPLAGGSPVERSLMLAKSVQCPRCGTSAVPGARFCASCGAPIAAAPGASPARKAGNGLVAASVVMLTLAAAVAGFLYLRPRLQPLLQPAWGPASGKSVVERTSISKPILDFRREAQVDIARSLDVWADPAAKAAFASFDTTFWPTAPARSGWDYFLGTSLVLFGTPAGDATPVAFYHPWSDVFVVTAWSSGPGSPRLVDAETVTGDFLRKGGRLPIDTAWAWEDGTYPPLAFGQSAARTMAAFDRLFGAGAGKAEKWRRRAGLDEAITVEANRVAAGFQLIRAMGELGALLVPQPDDQISQAIRSRVVSITQRVAAGQLGSVLSASPGTTPEARAALLALPVEAWTKLRTAAFLRGEESSVVLLSQMDQTDRFVALVFRQDEAGVHLDRADFLGFGAFSRLK